MFTYTCECLNKRYLTYQSPHQGHLYHSGIHGTEPSSALPCLQEHTSGDYSKDKFRSKQDKISQEHMKASQESPVISKKKFKYFHLFYCPNQFLIHHTDFCRGVCVTSDVHSSIYQSSVQRATEEITFVYLNCIVL